MINFIIQDNLYQDLKTKLLLKLRKENLIWSRVRGPAGGALWPALVIDDRPDRKRGTSQVGTTSLTQLLDRRFPTAPATAQPMRDGHSSANGDGHHPANEKPLYSQLRVPSNGLSVYNSLRPPTLAYKKSPRLSVSTPAWGSGGNPAAWAGDSTHSRAPPLRWWKSPRCCCEG